jgi:hypothetical protein
MEPCRVFIKQNADLMTQILNLFVLPPHYLSSAYSPTAVGVDAYIANGAKIGADS